VGSAVTSLLLPLFLFAVWFLWIPACLLEREARGDQGGFSVLPVFPVYPLIAWGLAALLERVYDKLGLMIVGGLHVLLLASFIVSIIRSLITIRRNKRNAA
jgi:hypothetical protein